MNLKAKNFSKLEKKSFFIEGTMSVSFIKLKLEKTIVLVKKSNNDSKQIILPPQLRMKITDTKFFIAGSNKSVLIQFLSKLNEISFGFITYKNLIE